MKRNSMILVMMFGSALSTYGSWAKAEQTNGDGYDTARQEHKKEVAGVSQNKGQEAFDKGNFTEACRYFDVAVQLDPAPDRKLDLFNCLEKLGQYATAAEKWRKIATTLTGQEKEYAESEAKRLDIQAPCIIVDVPIEQHTIPDMEVAIDGRAIPRVSWGKACTPVDLGDHTITAKAPGYGWPYQKPSTMATHTQYRVTITPPFVAKGPTSSPEKRDSATSKAIFAVPGAILLGVGAGALIFSTRIPNEEEAVRAQIFGFTLMGSAAVVLGTGGIIYAMAEPSAPEPGKRTGFSGYRFGVMGRF
jgi:hypothetical protein